MGSEKLNYINFTQKELDELFTLARQGNSKAFSDLSASVRQISLSYFKSKYHQGKIKDPDDIEDLTNNVYLSFAEQYEKIENLEYWLRRVLFLTFVNFYKKSRARMTFSLQEAFYIPEKEMNPGDMVDADKILAVLGTLSEDKQKILKMRFWEDLKFAEIAENLNKSEDAVKKMFYRTLEELKSKL